MVLKNKKNLYELGKTSWRKEDISLLLHQKTNCEILKKIVRLDFLQNAETL